MYNVLRCLLVIFSVNLASGCAQSPQQVVGLHSSTRPESLYQYQPWKRKPPVDVFRRVAVITSALADVNTSVQSSMNQAYATQNEAIVAENQRRFASYAAANAQYRARLEEAYQKKLALKRQQEQQGKSVKFYSLQSDVSSSGVYYEFDIRDLAGAASDSVVWAGKETKRTYDRVNRIIAKHLEPKNPDIESNFEYEDTTDDIKRSRHQLNDYNRRYSSDYYLP